MTETTAHDELAWIRSLMDQSQLFLSGSWRHQLAWGVVGTLGLGGTWLSVRAEAFTLIPWIWAVCVGGGWIGSFALTLHAARSSDVRSVASRAIGGIWLALGVSLTLLGTATVLGAVDPASFTGIIAITFGAGYFATGFTAGLRWLQAIGAAWWVGGVALLLWKGPDGLLVLAAMTLFLEVGPALRLRSIERGQRSAA